MTNKTFDARLCNEVDHQDLDFSAAAQLFEPHRTLQESDFLSLKIVEKNGEQITPTVAGVILFGKNRLEHFPNAYIRVATFKGIDRCDFLAKKDIFSFFPNAINEVINFIDDSPYNKFQPPKIALREALINAIVHTDYSPGGTPIRVAIFEDRLEIENTAFLPWGINFDDLDAGTSKIENPLIAKILSKLGLGEGWGGGIQRMRKACLESGFSEPEFQEFGNMIRVTLFHKESSEEYISKEDMNILKLLNSRGPLSAHQITDAMDLSKRTILNKISKLIKNGKIVEISQGPNDPRKKYTIFKS